VHAVLPLAVPLCWPAWCLLLGVLPSALLQLLWILQLPGQLRQPGLWQLQLPLSQPVPSGDALINTKDRIQLFGLSGS